MICKSVNLPSTRMKSKSDNIFLLRDVFQNMMFKLRKHHFYLSQLKQMTKGEIHYSESFAQMLNIEQNAILQNLSN